MKRNANDFYWKSLYKSETVDWDANGSTSVKNWKKIKLKFIWESQSCLHFFSDSKPSFSHCKVNTPRCFGFKRPSTNRKMPIGIIMDIIKSLVLEKKIGFYIEHKYVQLLALLTFTSPMRRLKVRTILVINFSNFSSKGRLKLWSKSPGGVFGEKSISLLAELKNGNFGPRLSV